MDMDIQYFIDIGHDCFIEMFTLPLLFIFVSVSQAIELANFIYFYEEFIENHANSSVCSTALREHTNMKKWLD